MTHPTPGNTYYANVSHAGHAPASRYVTVTGSHHGAVLDRNPTEYSEAAHLYTTREAAEQARDTLPVAAHGRRPDHAVERVHWHGGSIFTTAERP